jgi:hypothetical protein
MHATSEVSQAAAVPAALPRLIKVSAEGLLLPADAADWVAVYQPERQLTWTRDVVGSKRTWSKAVKAAGEVGLCGWQGGWRAPSRLDYAHLIDDALYGPTIDTAFFTVADRYQWEWTGTECAPSGYAWFVNLAGGGSYRDYVVLRGHVRAVRAGQLSWHSA